ATTRPPSAASGNGATWSRSPTPGPSAVPAPPAATRPPASSSPPPTPAAARRTRRAASTVGSERHLERVRDVRRRLAHEGPPWARDHADDFDTVTVPRARLPRPSRPAGRRGRRDGGRGGPGLR